MKLTRYRRLFPYQRTVLEWAAPRNRVALFLEMRLGKTLVSIRWAKSKGAKRILVLSPLSVFMAWQKELRLERISFTMLRGKDRVELARKCKGVALLNHEAVILSRDILRQKWDAIILDESDAIRNPKAKLSKMLTAVVEHIPLRAILSGLPNPESPLNFFQQFKFLNGSWLGYTNFYEWRFNRCRTTDFFGRQWGPTIKTQAAIEIALEQDSYRLSRKQAGIGERKVHEVRTVKILPKQRAAYKQIKKKFMVDLPSGEQWTTRWVLPKLNALHSLGGGFLPDGSQISDTKVKELVRLLRGELKNEPCVVWFRFNKEVRAVQAALRKVHVSCDKLLGSTDAQARAKRIRCFQRGEFRVMLCQTACATLGLDFSRADTAIYFSNYFSNRIRQQSEDRIVHPKKRVPLLYLDLCTEETEDADIVELLRDKHLDSKAFLGELVRRMQHAERSKIPERGTQASKGKRKISGHRRLP